MTSQPVSPTSSLFWLTSPAARGPYHYSHIHYQPNACYYSSINIYLRTSHYRHLILSFQRLETTRFTSFNEIYTVIYMFEIMQRPNDVLYADTYGTVLFKVGIIS